MTQSGAVRRIGEILREHGWVSPVALDRALAEHAGRGMRTCSLLVELGAIDADTASRALGEQHGVAAALQRHLDRRDRSLAALLPAASAQLYTALPLGRMSSGEVLVCVRDPRPELRGILMRAMKEKVVLAVAPAAALDALVLETYGESASEFEVDMGTQPIPISLHLELDDPPADDGGMPATFQLADLDDRRVSKDFTQSGAITVPRSEHSSAAIALPRTSTLLPPREASGAVPLPRTSTLPPREASGAVPLPRTSTLPPREASSAAIALPRTSTLPPREPPPRPAPPPPMVAPVPAVARTASSVSLAIPRTVTPAALASGTARPTREYIPLPISLADTLTAIGGGRTTDDICDAAMRFIAGRWRAALLFSVEGHDAVGMRGHGVKLTADVVRSISVSLAGPSILRTARDAAGKLITQFPPGGDDIHDQLEQLLSVPRYPAAVSIAVGSVVEYVLAIGDPHASDVATATGDLSRIATALSAAFTRLERR